MQLDRHLESVRSGLRNAAALADDHSQDIARRLGDALDSSVRLSLIDALSEAATEISADLAPGSVEFRLSDGEPQFVVTPPPPMADAAGDTADDTEDGDDEPVTLDAEDEEQVRFTLRLPASVKAKVDQAAAAEGVSTNTWLLQRVLMSLAGRDQRGRRGERGGRRPDGPRGPVGGWISPPWGGPPMRGEGGWSGFGPGTVPPAPPMPPFGPDFPFGHGGGRGGRRRHEHEGPGGRGGRGDRDERFDGPGGEPSGGRGDRRRFRGWAR